MQQQSCPRFNLRALFQSWTLILFDVMIEVSSGWNDTFHSCFNWKDQPTNNFSELNVEGVCCNDGSFKWTEQYIPFIFDLTVNNGQWHLPKSVNGWHVQVQQQSYGPTNTFSESNFDVVWCNDQSVKWMERFTLIIFKMTVNNWN